MIFGFDIIGLIVMFYANEHEPVHVHGKCQGNESKAEIISARAEEIVRKWIDFFVLHKTIKAERITERLR